MSATVEPPADAPEQPTEPEEIAELEELEELEAQRAFLFRSLDDLDAEWEAGDIAADDYTALRDDYTARAAAILRALEARRLHRPAPAPAAGGPGVAARRPRWPLAVSALLAVVLAIGAGVLVTRASGERLPGQSASGGPDQGISDLLDRATTADADGRVLDALKLYDAVLAREPDNVVALGYKGWLLGRQPNAELVAKAMVSLDRAVAVDPTFADAHVFRGLVLLRNKRPAEAVCELRTYLAIAPPGNPQSKQVEVALDEATRQAGGNAPPCPSAVQPAGP